MKLHGKCVKQTFEDVTFEINVYIAFDEAYDKCPVGTLSPMLSVLHMYHHHVITD